MTMSRRRSKSVCFWPCRPNPDPGAPPDPAGDPGDLAPAVRRYLTEAVPIRRETHPRRSPVSDAVHAPVEVLADRVGAVRGRQAATYGDAPPRAAGRRGREIVRPRRIPSGLTTESGHSSSEKELMDRESESSRTVFGLLSGSRMRQQRTRAWLSHL
jgi:hypothetical protein